MIFFARTEEYPVQEVLRSRLSLLMTSSMSSHLQKDFELPSTWISREQIPFSPTSSESLNTSFVEQATLLKAEEFFLGHQSGSIICEPSSRSPKRYNTRYDLDSVSRKRQSDDLRIPGLLLSCCQIVAM